MLKNELLTVTIDDVSSDGAGVAHIDGRAIFIKGALPSEVCEVKIIKISSSAVYGRLESIISPSPYRITPDCPYFGRCGGCDFRHASYEEELNIKLKRVNDALERIGGLDVRADEIIGADGIDGYRNKAIFAVSRNKEGRAVTGFYRSRSHDVVDVDSCLIQGETANKAAVALREWMNENNIPNYDEETNRGLIRHIFIREGMVCLVSFAKPPQLDALIAKLKKYIPELKSVILNINKSRGNTLLTGTFKTIWGSDYVETTICGLCFRLSPLSFCQVNTGQAERLYSRAVEYAALTGKETVLDLYCGAGAIGLIASKHATHVIGAEIVKDAIRDARINADLNGITNSKFICADASEAAARLMAEKLKPDVIFLDPPRKGLAPDVIKTVADMSPVRIVYVSCDPATLARDLKRFDSLGFVAKKVTAVDMFPRTVHVETVVLMSRTKN